MAGLRSLADVRPGEGRIVGAIAAVFATLELGRGIGEVGALTLVVDRYTEGILPWLQLPLGLIAMVVAIGFGAALGRIARARLFVSSLIGIGVLLAVESLLVVAAPDLAPFAWLTVMAAGALATTIAWTVAGSSLDARQAKRLFPLCTAAAIAGAFTGNIAAGPLTAAVGTTTLILAEGIAFVLAALLVRRLASISRASGWSPRTGSVNPVSDDLRRGFDEVRASPLFRRIALAYVLFSILGFLIAFRFAGAARLEAAGSPEVFATIVGTVSAIVMATSFLVSLVLANRFYGRFGVAAGGLLLPLVYLGGFTVWIVRFTFPTAAAVSIAQQVTQRGISNTAWSAFYNVVPVARRAQVLAFMDGVPSQLGVIAAGLLALTAGRFLAPELVPWIGLVIAALCTVVVVSVRRRYVDALVRTLRSGVAEQVLEGAPGLDGRVVTPDVRAALIRALDTPDAAGRWFAASLLARGRDPAARTAVLHLLDDPEPAVRALAIEAALGGQPVEVDTRDHAERALDALLRGTAPERATALATLRRIERGLPWETLAPLVGDADPAVRAEAIRSAGTLDETSADDRLLAALADPEPGVRRAAAMAVAGRPRTDRRVLERLDDPSADVRLAAISALDGHGSAVRAEITAWAERQVERALHLAAIRHRIVAGAPGPDGGAALRTFLVDVLDQRVARQQELCLAAVAVLGVPAARHIIRRGLAARDVDTRAQAIEALDSIGDRRLGSAIVRLVEGGPGATHADERTGLDRLRDDADPWIRGLARRITADGDGMATDDDLANLDTMLRLRQVPLFSGLAPEDLQRVAMVAREATFEAGAALIDEGASGDELFVILDGRVVVTRRMDDGSERTIRTYGVGDHIGELAVLRDRPRAATVRADGGPVRTLVLDGAALRAILLERPEAAMAMLATLAERISVQ